MTSRLKKIFLSKFTVWIAAALIGSVFLFSLDTSIIQQQGISFQTLMRSICMPRIKLGIDLQGGTYLVVGVEVEKAVENRLVSENRALDQLFEKQNFKARPVSKTIENHTISMSFNSEENANICYNFIRKEAVSLACSYKGSQVIAKLNSVEEQRVRTSSVEQGVSVLNQRLNQFGVGGVVVQRHGDRQIVVQLPGVDDPERVRSIITKTAHLEFKIVEKVAASKEALLDEFDGELPPDKMIVAGQKSNNAYAEEVGQSYLVSAYPDMTGDHIHNANMTFDEYGRVEVAFELDWGGAQKFRELTGNNIGRRLGIIIDDVMFSAPNISSQIGGKGRIMGINSVEEAQDLALVLRSGSLLAPIIFEQESRVGASLGQDSIKRGLLSCLVGLLFLLFFSILYYGFAGFCAMLALFYNLFLILLFLSYFKATLTLPGIAGMGLTIGMAIDASILIYERIKEVLAEGMPIRKAINEGFSGAMVVILDSNITTFLTGLVLFKFGGPAIKGFAVTLMAGIIATILSGVFFLKSIFEYILDTTRGKIIKF